MNNIEAVKELLPDVVLRIAELVGFPATEKLIKKMGGLQILVGKNIDKMDGLRAQLLIDSLGQHNAIEFTKIFGGDVVYIPRCLKALRELRNRSFLQDVDNLKFCGYSTAKALTELCPRYGFSDRFAWELIKTKKTEQQYDLF